MSASSAETTLRVIVRAAGPDVPRLLGLVEQRLVALAGGHGPVLAGHARDTIAAGGKRLRPLLVLLAAGPRATDAPELVSCAAAVELVHSATLVHDDVLDGARLRRGVPTVWARGGREMAVATGDLLFSRAFSELTAVGSLAAVRSLSRATSALAEGELLQRQDAWDGAVPVERYLRRCELKTARLFEAACELGAQAARRSQDETAALGAFGRAIGLAFQLLDDVIDVAGNAPLTGKHRGTDLLDGTVTLPLILARERDPRLAAVDLRAITTPEQAERLCERIEETGALGAAQARALHLVAEAKGGLLELALEDGQRRALNLVADSVADRRA
ncbi:MAG TPA: polyprenyl synthetase family protein [Solirubrobacteraceae bacterium]|nr:polyprenyl synthetase family protein [Solirubrobacteraceae bacterium]